MTILEINELVQACEEEFGVSAAAAVVAAPAAGGGEAAEEQTEVHSSSCLALETRRLRLSRQLEKLQVLDLRKLRSLLMEHLLTLRRTSSW